MADAEAPAHPDPGLPPTEPLDSSKKGEVEPVKPAQHGALSRLPVGLTTTVSKADEVLLRLNKLIKTTAGLGAALSTLNYSLYLAAYLHANSPTRAAVITYISRLVGRTPSKLPPGALAGATVSPLSAIGSLISETRTTLRLTGLLPLYIWLKTLLSKKTSANIDPIIHRVALVQCTAYITYQLVENIYHLALRDIIPRTVVEKRGGVMKWVVWSCRAWLIGVASDFLRLWREATLAREKRARGEAGTKAEQDEFDRKWWNEFITAASWFPVAVHYSVDGGLKGMNSGLVGLFGLVAGLNNFRNAWAATAN